MIVTPGSGVDDLVEQGAGVVIPNGNASALQTAIESLIDEPLLVSAYSERAYQIAEGNGWDQYRRKLVSAASHIGTA
jgi:glycosyltransferase involved in cell wall biosynthesis